jgi:hypothetical protein
MVHPPYSPDHMRRDFNLIGPLKRLLASTQFAADANSHLLAADTCHHFLLRQATSLYAMVGQMLKRQL